MSHCIRDLHRRQCCRSDGRVWHVQPRQHNAVQVHNGAVINSHRDRHYVRRRQRRRCSESGTEVCLDVFCSFIAAVADGGGHTSGAVAQRRWTAAPSAVNKCGGHPQRRHGSAVKVPPRSVLGEQCYRVRERGRHCGECKQRGRQPHGMPGSKGKEACSLLSLHVFLLQHKIMSPPPFVL